ncbi:hypothetical protein SAMN02799638_04493, partial [Arthrobacter sp. UNCCL28]
MGPTSCDRGRGTHRARQLSATCCWWGLVFDGGLVGVVGVVGCWVGWCVGGGFALGVGGVYCFLSRRVRNGKPEGVYGSVG